MPSDLANHEIPSSWSLIKDSTSKWSLIISDRDTACLCATFSLTPHIAE